jgi:hypothetical protein
MVKTAKPASLDDLLIAQVTGLIRATAEEAANKDPHLAYKYEAHFHKLIGVNCTAKAQMFDDSAQGVRK